MKDKSCRLYIHTYKCNSDTCKNCDCRIITNDFSDIIKTKDDFLNFAILKSSIDYKIENIAKAHNADYITLVLKSWEIYGDNVKAILCNDYLPNPNSDVEVTFPMYLLFGDIDRTVKMLYNQKKNTV